MGISKDALVAELQAIRQAKLTALQTGQQVQMPGAIGATLVSYAELCRQESAIRGRLLRAVSGVTTRLRPSYTATSRDWTDD